MSDMMPEAAAQEIREEFAFLDDWEDRYAHIIDLGKANPALPEEEITEANRVQGCVSQVWIVTEQDDTGVMHIRAMSDAMIVSGLIAILIRIFSGSNTEDILDFDAEAFLQEIGVSGALTAQRSNGLTSMLARIRRDAEAIRARQSSAGRTVS